jgi:hypothetical protein
MSLLVSVLVARLAGTRGISLGAMRPGHGQHGDVIDLARPPKGVHQFRDAARVVEGGAGDGVTGGESAAGCQ